MMQDMIPFQGLRGVCAMAIFLGHQNDLMLAPMVPGQTVWIGLEYLQAVSLFFLLSGIPLARLYSATGKVETWQGTKIFWWKRCARLAPIYYLTLVLNLVVILVIAQEIDVIPLLQSFFGCAFFLQGWNLSLINVGGVLWQVAVFVFGYLFFPFLSKRVASWSVAKLQIGILVLWLFSAGLWGVGFALYPITDEEMLLGWWMLWHVNCISRLPHIFAGVLLGEIVERKRHQQDEVNWNIWGIVTDAISLLLLLTAIQAPIVQWYYGATVRANISVGLQALLLPIHALWLAGMVLAYRPLDLSSDNRNQRQRECWTRQVLSFQPLVALGDVSLVLYCIHLVVMFTYNSIFAYITRGDWHLIPSIYDYTVRVKVSCWHAPIQWVLVVMASFAVSKWFEAPMRKLLVDLSRQSDTGGTAQEKDTGSTNEVQTLLPTSTTTLSYGGSNMP